MKTKLLGLWLLLSLFGPFLMAQTKRGNRELSTYGWLNYDDDHESKSSSFRVSLSQSVGHFFADNFVAGAGVWLHNGVFKNALGKTLNRGISLNAYGRYYVPILDRLKVPLELSFGYSRNWYKNNQGPSQSQSGRLIAQTGLEYFFDPTLSIGLTGGYVLPVIDPEGRDSGLAIANLGFTLYFEPKPKPGS